MSFTDAQIKRYARHILLPEVGGKGQQKLLSARVLVIGAGGLGSPLLLYLAAAGIGTIGIHDDDVVELSNLQRQVVHDTTTLGQLKVDSAIVRLQALNPEVRVERFADRLTAATALDRVGVFDIVVDGSDNFATRYLLNDACYLAGRPLVSAAMLRFEAQLSTFKAHLGDPHPCYRCLFPAPPEPGTVPTCSEAGVFGALPGVLGSMQAIETIKEILGIGEGLSGRLLLYDALEARLREIALPRDPGCPLCGDHPTLTDLAHHHGTAHD
ncbi:adenylyltransferase/sulfurtransferase [Inquilinus ginsengisoli]|uniref:Adenylyltransferase/sulfurtransferase n=1 Tax=Inquilinus ginsengisoli TaxID=363840 RepID=A0ABU1JW12_9PROT|nr:molybdopterin-synthase adenylyltransferase MoeB [Inquilinus ginsengisoli]MDR6292497.1 adenylyltransferase/sulfurtransferase [Inquilinus ginsengisoli]